MTRPVALISPLLFTTLPIASLACPAVRVTAWVAVMLPLFSICACKAASVMRARIRPSPVTSSATVLPAASVALVAMICPAFCTLLPTSTTLPVAAISPSLRMTPVLPAPPLKL